MKSFSKSLDAVGSESAKHSKHPVALRLFYSVIVAVVAAALLPVIPAAAKPVAPSVASAPASAYIPVTPVRLLDTRSTGGPLGPLGTRNLVVTGGSPLAPTGATAVMLNVTVTDTTAASFLTVFGTSSSQPIVSNLNWKAGETIPNLVETPVGAGGSVTFFNAAGSTNVVADLEGYFFAPSGSAGGEVALTPARITDTRAGSGKANAGSTLGASGRLDIQVTGAGGVPTTGVSGAILNVTVTNTTAPSFLTVWPTGATQNTVSNLNWVAGKTIANRVFVPVGTGGKVSVFNAVGSTDVVVDVSGYFTDATAKGQLFTPQIPLRIEDTRSDGKTLVANTSFNVQVGGVVGVPISASAAMLNVTATDTTAPSFLTVYPADKARPVASDLNWTPGVTIPNLTVATLGSTGTVAGAISIYNAVGSVDVVVDLFGFFGGPIPGVTVTATPSSLPADGTSTSKIDTTVLDANGNPIVNDTVVFVKSGSPAAACGALSSASGITNLSGVVPTITYTASTTPGTCTITATETIGGKTGTVIITQTAVPNRIDFTPHSNCTFAGCVANVDANGVATINFSTVTFNSLIGGVGAGDMLTFTTTPSTAGSCGTIGTISGTPAGTTDASSIVTFVYTASSTVGFCTINGTDSTNATGSALVVQNVPGGFNANSGTLTETTTSTDPQTCGLPICVFANGTDTVTVTYTVSGPSHQNDPVIFVFSPPAGAPQQTTCGTLSSTLGTTNSLGVATVTYTASTKVGFCTIKATEANSATFTSFTLRQDVVKNGVVVSASPQNIPATTSSTSTLTVTVTSGITGAAVAGDTIAFGSAGDPGGACGAITANSSPTNASGQVTATYTATTTIGFCTITATDTSAGGGSGTVRIVQTNPASAALTTTVTALPTSLQANGTSTSAITATVKTSGGTAVAGDLVQFTLSSGCGTLDTFVLASRLTDASGNVTAVYHATTTVLTCTITATEANSASSGAATVTQTAVIDVVTVTPASATITVGSGADVITVNVKHNGVNVSGDAVSFATSGSPSAACGAITASSSPTDAGGNVTATYTATATTGFCTITATESASGGSGTATITQTSSPAATNTVTVTDNKSGTLVADGTSTATITATVAGTNTVADEVMFTLTPSVAGACGTITPTAGNTGVGTTVTATYKASTTVGTCTITATEANGNSSGTDPMGQTQRPNTITLSANPTTVSAGGAGTSTLTVTVTDSNTNAGISGDAISFTKAASPAGACGVISGSATTDSSGVLTVTYTASSTQGGCVITAHEAATSQDSNTATIIQGP